MTDAPENEEVGTYRFTGTYWRRDDPTGDGSVTVRRGEVVTVYSHEYDAVKHQLDPLDIPGTDDGDETNTDSDSDATYSADGYDADEFADLSYTERAAAVRNGLVDEGLDEIIDTDGSTTVVDAAKERRELVSED